MPSRNIESRKETGGAVALVIMGHGAAPTFFQRQTRLSTIEGLNLGFLVHARYQCLVGRIKIDADNVGKLFHEAFVSGELKGPYSVRLKTVGSPYLGHHVMTDPLSLGHTARTPVCGVGRYSVQCGLHYRLDLFPVKPPGTWTFRGVLGQPNRSLILETLAPNQDGRTTGLQLPSNRRVGEPLYRQQANPRPKRNTLRSPFGADPRLQLASLLATHRQRLGFVSHGPGCNTTVTRCQDIMMTLH